MPMILSKSLESTISKQMVDAMLHYFETDANLLVIGPVLAGHVFEEGRHKVNGRNIPWNTFAIWHTAYLGLIGFPLVGDGGADASRGGVEVGSCQWYELLSVSYRGNMAGILGMYYMMLYCSNFGVDHCSHTIFVVSCVASIFFVGSDSNIAAATG
jgi:hypothetical protein